MVPLDHEDQDAGAPQPQHLLAEEQARSKVGPVAIVDVASEQDDRHILFKGEFDQSNQRLA
jgi:hypothetical protein